MGTAQRQGKPTHDDPPSFGVARNGNERLASGELFTLGTHRMAELDPQQPSDSYVQSFARGLSVIRAFGPGRSQMTLSEVAAVTGLTRAGARRILLTLEHLGYVTVDDRKFELTPRILEL
ncbi:MAG: helix-turn-helix domain-containing protein, partial [Alcaligenes sp.]